jgi:hypothetical protein
MSLKLKKAPILFVIAIAHIVTGVIWLGVCDDND